MSEDNVLQRILAKLKTRSPLNQSDGDAILALPYTLRDLDPGEHILREGEVTETCSFIVSGFAYRQKLSGTGERQILAIHIPGDILDLPSLFLRRADHNIQALSHNRIAFIPYASIEKLVLSNAAIARAMWIDVLIDGSIFREWILNVGRRDAFARIAHLLCEFAVRFETAGLTQGEGDGYELPMTQEQIADAVGLTPVHVNRTLQRLSREGLITRQRRYVRIENWDALVVAGDFSKQYLHLDHLIN